MAEWNLLPANVRQRIVELTVFNPIADGSVPSAAQVRTNQQVSREFRSTTADVLERDYGAAVRVMRDSEFGACNQLLDGLLAAPPITGQRCALLVYRIAQIKGMKELKSGMVALSNRLAAGQVSVADATPMLLQLLKLAIGCGPVGGSALGDEDTEGIAQLVEEISGRFPASEYVCVALGASADPVAVGLAMQGHCVVYLALSGIEDSSRFKMNNIGYVQAQVAQWPANPVKLLLLDAMSSGTALRVAKGMIEAACKNLGRPLRPITLFALNPPQGNEQAAASVSGGQIQVAHSQAAASQYAQQQIYLQNYKEGYLGRMYAKSSDEGASKEMNQEALKRMVAALLQRFTR